MADYKTIVQDNGIKVELGGGWYVVFDKEWDNLEVRSFTKTKDDLAALKMLLEKVVEWRVPMARTWEPIPFDRASLVQQIDDFVNEKATTCWRIPAQLQRAMISAYIDAYRASCELPLRNGSLAM